LERANHEEYVILQVIFMETKPSSYYENPRVEMIDFISHLTPKKILEIGCGAGNFRNNFLNVEYWGVEPVESVAATARRKLTRVLVGTYEPLQTDIPDHYFDLIVCNDVIEHMVDPRKFLIDIKDKLAADGRLLVSLPNARYAVTLFNLLFKGRLDYTASGDLDYTHLHLFTMKSFESMAEVAGWELEQCRHLLPRDFKPLKRIVIKAISLFIPEVEADQFGALLKIDDRPNRKTVCAGKSLHLKS